MLAAVHTPDFDLRYGSLVLYAVVHFVPNALQDNDCQQKNDGGGEHCCSISSN